MLPLQGIAVSKGFAKASAFWLEKRELKSLREKQSLIEEEKLFLIAIEKAKNDLEILQQKLKDSKSQAYEVLNAHIQLLEDPELIDKTIFSIKENNISACEAYNESIAFFKNMFLSMEDDYLKERVNDLEDISQRVLFYIQSPNESFLPKVPDQPFILFAEDLKPSDILSIDRNLILGIVCEAGSQTSHVAILARSMEIPAVLGVGNKLKGIVAGENVFLNALDGYLFLESSNFEIKNKFDEQVKLYSSQLELLKVFKGKNTQTACGKKITLSANISGPQDMASVLNNDAEAIGLYRTEFLFLDRASAPSEEEQYRVYKQVADQIGNKKIIVRTVDIGGDKETSWLQIQKEENPFLGLRGIRLCLAKPELFKAQLRALLRAMVGKNWGLMFPMVSSLEEFLEAKEILNQVIEDLKGKSIQFSNEFELGIMVEVPSVAWMMDEFSEHLDFISLGTNDLLQYTCAADRLNLAVADVYNYENLGFLRLISHVVKEAKRHELHVGICGSLAHKKELLPMFISLGVDELSMSAQHILPTRKLISELVI
ncbi:MAG: phosphoenolpyruvate--protein phosphotransferase [Oligoflexia bacterium]|nr:phosphoenolpyruvate--protein phosphotransferase [Oligoflexia bacterium]